VLVPRADPTRRGGIRVLATQAGIIALQIGSYAPGFTSHQTTKRAKVEFG
jgi:hypothetical protein